MPRNENGGRSVATPQRLADTLKSAEKPQRPAKYRPMSRISLAWSPDFVNVRAALNLPPEAKDGSDRSGDGRSK